MFGLPDIIRSCLHRLRCELSRTSGVSRRGSAAEAGSVQLTSVTGEGYTTRERFSQEAQAYEGQSEVMISDQFRVPGISCQHCVNAITRAVKALPGVRQVVVNLSDKSVRVEHDQQVTADDLIRAINDAGYDEVAVLV